MQLCHLYEVLVARHSSGLMLHEVVGWPDNMYTSPKGHARCHIYVLCDRLYGRNDVTASSDAVRALSSPSICMLGQLCV